MNPRKPGNEQEAVGLEFRPPGASGGVHAFSHEAMATVFELHLAGDDANYARQAAREVFEEVDRLEGELSRFVESSDINRLNHAAAGESVSLGIDTFNCLQKAREVFDLTRGVFDITIGRLYECWMDRNKQPRQPTREALEAALELTGMDKVRLDPQWMTAEVSRAGIRFDLGGIGKGYAADRIAGMLRDWSIDSALILAGASSVLALGSPPDREGWAFTFSHPLQPGVTLLRMAARDRALGGSGMQQGKHIIDPRDASCRPVQGRIAAWSSAPDATTADALSTAFMILDAGEIGSLCREHPEVRGAVLFESGPEHPPGTEFQRFGAWENEG